MINKAMKAALKAITILDRDVTKTYIVERQVKTLSGKMPAKAAEEYDIWDQQFFCGGESVPVRIFSTKEQTVKNLPVLLFFHGGGWVMGNIDSYSRVCSVMAEMTNHRVVSVDYRLAPEYKFPYGLNDCYAVTQEIMKNGILGVGPEDVTLIGDSAGGNLAAAVALMARDRNEYIPKRQILLYPVTYHKHNEKSPFLSVMENGDGYLLTSKRVSDMISLYKRTDGDLQNPYFAPLLAENFHHMPDTLIITAEYDPLRDEGEYYGKRLKQDGNKVRIHRMADALHGFMSLPPRFEHVKIAYEFINDFLSSER